MSKWRNKPVSNIEVTFAASRHLITTTDKRGVITFVNQAFVDVSGYQETELLGQNHNIIRHPDMPKGAFKDLWQTIQQGLSWRGAVKNRCANGDYYWVDAYVSPILQNGKIVEFQSVRIALDEAAKKRAEIVYAAWRHDKLPGWLTTAPRLDHTRWARSGQSEPSVTQRVMQYIYTGERRFRGRLNFIMGTQRNELRAVVARLKVTGRILDSSREKSQQFIGDSRARISEQYDQITAFSNDIEALVASQNSVLQASTDTASAATEASQEAGQGQQKLVSMTAATERLTAVMHATQTQVENLSKRSEQINAVVNVISEVAEQTNLLALNAAIEAARAGESGRGFAVVADEVRALAQRTHDSTGEISRLVADVLQEMTSTVHALQEGTTAAEETAQAALSTKEVLTSIIQRIQQIETFSGTVSGAVAEQQHATDRLREKILTIEQMGSESVQAANAAEQESDTLGKLIRDLNHLAGHFLAQRTE